MMSPHDLTKLTAAWEEILDRFGLPQDLIESALDWVSCEVCHKALKAADAQGCDLCPEYDDHTFCQNCRALHQGIDHNGFTYYHE